MERLQDYALQAKECRALAAKAALPEIRKHLLEMADRWEELARQRAAHLHLEHMLAGLLKDRNGNHNGGAAADA